MLSGIVYTDTQLCEACSACLRVCKTKSIRVADGKSSIIKESCLNCGTCVNICSKGAKKYRQSIANVQRILKGRPAAMILAPSYVIVAVEKYHCSAEQFCTALKQLGFSLVYESSFGADVVSKVYADYLVNSIADKGQENTHIISSPCPSIMNYMEKHAPVLLEEFAPILSPMAAQAVIAKHWSSDQDLAIVGATPCIAKKSELLDPELGLYDEKMTFVELIQLIDSQGIIPSELEESDFDGVQPFYGAGFPISGGLTKTLEQFTSASDFNLIGNDYTIIEGHNRSVKFLEHMAQRKMQAGNLSGYPLLVDILYCEGCIMGEALGVDISLWEARRIVSEYTQKRFKKVRASSRVESYQDYTVLIRNTARAPEFKRWLDIVNQLIQDNKFYRTWNDMHYEKKEPNAEELRYILECDGKYSPTDELNCGACGYDSCRDRAKAVFNGENELGGCIMHIKYEAKISSEENKRLHELDQMKSDFLSTVSHELRTPLTSILGFSKIIDKRLASTIFPQITSDDKKIKRAVRQVRDNVGIIISESERLTRLINDVLDLSKMEAGKVEWQVEPLSLAEVIEGAISATTSLFAQKDLKLIKEIPKDLPLVKGDRDRLVQTVINLISNAVKFTDEGSITCRAEYTGNTLNENNEIIVSVIDTGTGISREYQEKVFEKFKQAGDTLTDKPKGTGLGLPICKQIVEQHGGKIRVESQPGKGTSFVFTIPAGPAGKKGKPAVDKMDVDTLLKHVMEKVTTPASSSGDYSHKKILVVDDDANIRMLLKQELEAVGYQISEAADGIEALAAVKKETPDLILLDVMMPRMSGFDVAAVLKNDPKTMNVPIIILSIVEDRERGFRIGVDRYFSKPLDSEKLLNEISVLIAQGDSRKKVLVVDNDRSALKTLVDVLEARGYIVVEVSDSDELVKKAVTEKPDMIIVDKVSSQYNQVIKTLRFEKGMENVYFLLLGDRENKERQGG